MTKILKVQVILVYIDIDILSQCPHPMQNGTAQTGDEKNVFITHLSLRTIRRPTCLGTYNKNIMLNTHISNETDTQYLLLKCHFRMKYILCLVHSTGFTRISYSLCRLFYKCLKVFGLSSFELDEFKMALGYWNLKNDLINRK